MPIFVRKFLDTLVANGSTTKSEADSIFEQYLRVKGDYLAGNLDKNVYGLIAKGVIDLERKGLTESDNLPSLEDTALLMLVWKAKKEPQPVAMFSALLDFTKTICPKCYASNDLGKEICDQCGASLNK
jgi:ribosomal protein L40E